MGTNAIPRSESPFTAANYDFGKWSELESPKIYQAFKKGGIKEVLKTFATDSEYQPKPNEPLEMTLWRAAGRNALVVLDDVGRAILGGVEATLGGVVGPLAGIVAMLESLPPAFWIAIHGAANGAEAFRRLDSEVQKLMKDGKWSAHEQLWQENKAVIKANWEKIKDKESWQLAAEGLECFATGLARMALAAGSAPVNAAQAGTQVVAGTAVAVGRPIGIAILEFFHLAKPLGDLMVWIGKGFQAVGTGAHEDAKKLAKNTIWAEIPGLETKGA